MAASGPRRVGGVVRRGNVSLRCVFVHSSHALLLHLHRIGERPATARTGKRTRPRCGASPPVTVQTSHAKGSYHPMRHSVSLTLVTFVVSVGASAPPPQKAPAVR